MNQIPAEILNNIFSHLHQIDKVTCMCVCQYWRQTIEYCTLYHTVCLGTSHRMHELALKIQEDPTIAHEIEQVVLILDYYLYEKKLYTFLSSLRNVKRLYFSDNSGDKRPIELQIDYQFRDHIGYISEHSIYSIAHSLLSTGLCPKLTTLIIEEFGNDIIPLLKNAPALKRLSLELDKISFSDLNSIHSNVTGLRSLRIGCASFDETGFDDITTPAVSIIACVFLKIKIQQARFLWEYIYTKYPNISKLACDLNGGLNISKAFDEENYNGWIRLFQSYGIQLKKISHFDHQDNNNLFESLDKNDCQLNYLHLVRFPEISLGKIIDSDQSRCLKTLVLYNEKFPSLSWLKHLQVLEKFKLIAHPFLKPRTIVCLTETLTCCPPTLKILSFEDLIISNHLDSVNPTNVKTLSFNRVTLPFGADVYIVHHFPKLSKFKLKVCKTQVKKFNLSPIKLSTFHYTDIPHYRKIRISTIDSGEQLVYHAGSATTLSGFDKELKGLLSPTTTLPLDEGRNPPDFVFVCHSLKSLALT